MKIFRSLFAKQHLYREELEYKLEHDADALIEQMADVSFVVHPDRPNSLAGGPRAD